MEIGVDDLAMDEGEAHLLLDGAGVGLAEAEVAELVGHTEGWPVGLYLAALAHKSGTGRRTGGFAFSGDDRLMADYLRTELLSVVSRGRVSFLTRTSVLERMCGPLCDAVVDGTRSGRVLEALEGSNLLLVPLDRRREWYRYHRLFQQLLRVELGQREADVVAQLHARAAAWYESNGLPEMAITHAQAGGDADQVARLVTARTLVAYGGGRLETVDRWFQWFDDHDLIDRYPSVAVLGAVLRAVMGQSAAAERWAAVAERASATETLPDGSSLESWQAQHRAFLCRQGVGQMRRDAEIARTVSPPGASGARRRWRSRGSRGCSTDEPERADPILAQAVEVGLDTQALPRRPPRSPNAPSWPSGAKTGPMPRRWRSRASPSCGRDISTTTGRARSSMPSWHGPQHTAATFPRPGEPRQAARLRPQLTYAVPFLAVQTLVELARAYLALADPAGARVVLREASAILRLRPDLGSLPREADELSSTIDTLRVGSVGASSLTAAELRLVPLLSTHLSFREIGERLYVSRHTVKTQAISIYRKLGVSSRSEAIDRVLEIGLLT